jgi:hypothetical protein
MGYEPQVVSTTISSKSVTILRLEGVSIAPNGVEAITLDSRGILISGSVVPTVDSANTWTRQQTFRAANSDTSSIYFTSNGGGTDVASQSIRWIRTDLSMPYGLGTYMNSTGAFYTGKFITISNKRVDVNGAIMGISATSDGAEPNMFSVTPDVNGPAVAIEASGAPTGSLKNQAAIGFYDLDTGIGGNTAYSSGYHAKKAQVTGDGTWSWGANLSTDPNANYETRLAPNLVSASAKGLLLTANASQAVLDLYETNATAALRNWRITTNSVANGSFDVLVSASQGVAPSVTALSIDSSGNVLGKSFRGTAVAFASLPTAVEGMLVAVTDSTTTTWGATITGGGANHVLAYYNGSNWTVAGK